MNYKQMNNLQLKNAFKKAKEEWKSLPRKSSFSGLSISSKLNKIQNEMFKRNIKFKEFITEINIEIG